MGKIVEGGGREGQGRRRKKKGMLLYVEHLLYSVAQVANTRPKGQIQPSTLFYPAWHLNSTWWQH